jgi:hypothetical protein
MLSAMQSRVVAVTTIASLTFACGGAVPPPKLDPAGSKGDDGSGLLAEASVQFMTSSDEGGFEPDPAPNRGYGYGYGYDYGGGYYGGYTYGGFGGDWYGGGAYGGNIYASFQPYMPYTTTQRVVDYTVSYATDHGAIEGQVTWPKPPSMPATLDGPSGCGKVDNPSLRLGKGNTVEGAIVYLEKITQGRGWQVQQYSGYKPISTGGSIELRECALTPRVQVQMPVPGQLALSNAHDVPVTLVADRPGDTSTRIEQRLDVGATRVVGLQSAGVTRIGDQAGALSPAWIVSGNHPYYALTDDRGRFRLDDVVAGDYTLIAWHPPVVTGIVDGKAVYGDPVIVKKKITVKKTASTTVAFALP